MAALCCGFVLLASFFGISELGVSAFFTLFPKPAEYLVEHWGWLAIYLDYVLWPSGLAVVAVWLALLGLALVGSAWPMPGLRALSYRTWVVRGTFWGNAVTWLLIPCVLVFGLYSTSMISRNREGAAVYFLYDEGIGVPRSFYAMGLSRIAHQAEQNWGRHCTVLDSLTQETLRTALTSGKVIILATHGEGGYVGTYYAPQTLIVGPAPLGATDQQGRRQFLQTTVLADYWKSRDRLLEGKWEHWKSLPVGDQVQLVYLFACHGGAKASEWQEHLAPARVISYNRFSWLSDHASWFAITGPSELQHLK